MGRAEAVKSSLKAEGRKKFSVKVTPYCYSLTSVWMRKKTRSAGTSEKSQAHSNPENIVFTLTVAPLSDLAFAYYWQITYSSVTYSLG